MRQAERVGRRGMARAARWAAALALVASSRGCVLTQEIPDPALDVPGGYKVRRPRADGRAARARLVARLSLGGNDQADGGGPEGQSRHRRRRRAHACRPTRRRGRRGRRCCRACRVGGQENLFPHLGVERLGPDQPRSRGRELFGLAERELRDRLLGPEPRCAAGR